MELKDSYIPGIKFSKPRPQYKRDQEEIFIKVSQLILRERNKFKDFLKTLLGRTEFAVYLDVFCRL